MRMPGSVSESTLNRIEAIRALRERQSEAKKAKNDAFLQGSISAIPIFGQGAGALTGYLKQERTPSLPQTPPSTQPPLSRAEQGQALDARNWSAPVAEAPPVGVGASVAPASLIRSLDARQWRPPAQPPGGRPAGPPAGAGGPSLLQRYQGVSPYLQNNADALILQLLLGV